MRAVIYEDRLRFETDYPAPDVPSGWARIRVSLVGVCRTDLEILKGYMGFTGVLTR